MAERKKRARPESSDARLDAGAKVPAHDPAAIPRAQERHGDRVRFDGDPYVVAEKGLACRGIGVRR